MFSFLFKFNEIYFHNKFKRFSRHKSAYSLITLASMYGSCSNLPIKFIPVLERMIDSVALFSSPLNTIPAIFIL